MARKELEINASESSNESAVNSNMSKDNEDDPDSADKVLEHEGQREGGQSENESERELPND